MKVLVEIFTFLNFHLFINITVSLNYPVAVTNVLCFLLVKSLCVCGMARMFLGLAQSDSVVHMEACQSWRVGVEGSPMSKLCAKIGNPNSQSREIES